MFTWSPCTIYSEEHDVTEIDTSSIKVPSLSYDEVGSTILLLLLLLLMLILLLLLLFFFLFLLMLMLMLMLLFNKSAEFILLRGKQYYIVVVVDVYVDVVAVVNKIAQFIL